MTANEKLLEFQRHWFNRIYADKQYLLQQAEEQENYEVCHELKASIEKSVKEASIINLNKYVGTKAFSHPRLIFDLAEYLFKIQTKKVIRRIEQEDCVGYEFTYQNHLLQSIRVDEEIELNPQYANPHSKYVNIGSVENGRTYIIDKVCNCKAEILLGDLINSIALTAADMLDEKEKSNKINSHGSK